MTIRTATMATPTLLESVAALKGGGVSVVTGASVRAVLQSGKSRQCDYSELRSTLYSNVDGRIKEIDGILSIL